MNITKKRVAIGAGFAGVIGLGAAVGVALAEGHGRHGWGHGGGGHKGKMIERIFERHDLDQNGEITREEAEAGRKAFIEEMDANGDGQISKDEFRDFRMKRAGERADKRFDRMDANGDGVLGAAEVMSRRSMKMFDRADRNNDGVVTREEAEKMAKRGRGRHRGEGRHHGEGHHGGGRD